MYVNFLTFRDTNKQFELEGDLLKLKTNKNYNVDHPSLWDENLRYDFAKKMIFDVKTMGNKSTRDRSLINFLISPAIMVFGLSSSRRKKSFLKTKTIFLSSTSNELCNRLRLFLREKQVGNNSEVIDEEIVAILDNLSEYKCICKKQHRQLLIKRNLLHAKKK